MTEYLYSYSSRLYYKDPSLKKNYEMMVTKDINVYIVII